MKAPPILAQTILIVMAEDSPKYYRLQHYQNWRISISVFDSSEFKDLEYEIPMGLIIVVCFWILGVDDWVVMGGGLNYWIIAESALMWQ